MGDLVAIHGERMQGGKRKFCLGVGLALIACPVTLGRADQLVIEDKHCKILGVTTKWAVTATSLPI